MALSNAEKTANHRAREENKIIAASSSIAKMIFSYYASLPESDKSAFKLMILQNNRIMKSQ